MGLFRLNGGIAYALSGLFHSSISSTGRCPMLLLMPFQGVSNKIFNSLTILREQRRQRKFHLSKD